MDVDVLRDPAWLHAHLLYAGNGNRGAARAGDFCAHRVQEIREIDDLGFAGGAFNDRDAVGECSGHHDVAGAEDG